MEASETRRFPGPATTAGGFGGDGLPTWHLRSECANIDGSAGPKLDSQRTMDRIGYTSCWYKIRPIGPRSACWGQLQEYGLDLPAGMRERWVLPIEPLLRSLMSALEGDFHSEGDERRVGGFYAIRP